MLRRVPVGHTQRWQEVNEWLRLQHRSTVPVICAPVCAFIGGPLVSTAQTFLVCSFFFMTTVVFFTLDTMTCWPAAHCLQLLWQLAVGVGSLWHLI